MTGKIFLRAAFAVLIACIATGFGDIAPALAQTATSAPSPTPDPCNHEAMITHAAKLTFPSVAGNVGPGAYYATTVQIDIDSTGKITKTTTILSSGYGDMDDAALKAAAASTYQPKVVNCKAVPSAYLFHAAFSVP